MPQPNVVAPFCTLEVQTAFRILKQIYLNYVITPASYRDLVSTTTSSAYSKVINFRRCKHIHEITNEEMLKNSKFSRHFLSEIDNDTVHYGRLSGKQFSSQKGKNGWTPKHVPLFKFLTENELLINSSMARLKSWLVFRTLLLMNAGESAQDATLTKLMLCGFHRRFYHLH